MREETYEIHALRYAYHQRTRQENFLEIVDAHDAPMPIDYFIWLVRNENRTVVIDTGFDRKEARKRDRSDPAAPLASTCQAGGGGVERRERRDHAPAL